MITATDRKIEDGSIPIRTLSKGIESATSRIDELEQLLIARNEEIKHLREQLAECSRDLDAANEFRVMWWMEHRNGAQHV